MDPHHAQIKGEREGEEEKEKEWGDVFLEEFDRSLLDGLLWKTESFWCLLPNLSSFPLSSFWLMREERGKDRRWDRELSAVWCPGTPSPALISSDSAASLGLICTIAAVGASAMCNLPLTVLICSVLLCRERFYLSCVFGFKQLGI